MFTFQLKTVFDYRGVSSIGLNSRLTSSKRGSVPADDNSSVNNTAEDSIDEDETPVS